MSPTVRSKQVLGLQEPHSWRLRSLAGDPALPHLLGLSQGRRNRSWQQGEGHFLGFRAKLQGGGGRSVF